ADSDRDRRLGDALRRRRARRAADARGPLGRRGPRLPALAGAGRRGCAGGLEPALAPRRAFDRERLAGVRAAAVAFAQEASFGAPVAARAAGDREGLRAVADGDGARQREGPAAKAVSRGAVGRLSFLEWLACREDLPGRLPRSSQGLVGRDLPEKRFVDAVDRGGEVERAAHPRREGDREAGERGGAARERFRERARVAPRA